MLADGIGAAATKKGPRHVPLAALREGYITFSSTWKGAMTCLGTSQPWQLPRRTAGHGSKADAGARHQVVWTSPLLVSEQVIA
jgi:hypothetical protein